MQVYTVRGILPNTVTVTDGLQTFIYDNVEVNVFDEGIANAVADAFRASPDFVTVEVITDAIQERQFDAPESDVS